jgi:hypothetical protein
MKNFANIYTNEEADTRPAVPATISTKVGLTTSPTPEQQEEWYRAKGWRKPVSEDKPSVGCRITKTKVVDTGDGLTCRISIVSQINIADELAAQDAANAKATEDRRKAMVEYLCQSESVRLCVALLNLRIDKPFLPEDIRAEAEKILA